MPGPPIHPHEPGLLRKLVSPLLDLLYPPGCAVCHKALKNNRSLCPPCGAALPRLIPPFCSLCAQPYHGRIDGDFECPNCRDLDFAFDFARPAMLRDDRTLQMIHHLKYLRAIHLARELAILAAEAFADPRLRPALEEKWHLVPVPLHRSRHQWRHFNQAAEIAGHLSRSTGLPVVHALRRIRKTATQTRLTRQERLANLRSAFVPASSIPAEKPGAILIDDVFTTGSTVDACAAVLRRAGYRRIAVVTVMRG